MNCVRKLSVAFHEIMHELPNNLDGFVRLRIVHRNANRVARNTQRVASNVQPPVIVVRLLQKFLNKLAILRGSSVANSKNDLHAGTVLEIVYKRIVKSARIVDEIVEKVGPALREVLEVRNATFCKHPFSHERTKPDREHDRNVVDTIGCRVEFIPVAHGGCDRDRIFGDKILADDGVANLCFFSEIQINLQIFE